MIQGEIDEINNNDDADNTKKSGKRGQSEEQKELLGLPGDQDLGRSVD